MEGDNSGHKVQDVEQESVTKNNSPLNSYKNDTERSTCSGHFKKCDIPRSGGSILQLMEELIKVGQTMGYNMEGCITNIGDIINSQGANDGFDTFVKQTWNDAQVTDSNAISMFMKKMKYLKEKIRMWVKANKENSKSHKQCLQEELSGKLNCFWIIGEGSSTLISKRMEILKSIQDFVKLDTMELAQKAKIKWAIEGDENLKYYHGVLNKKRNQLGNRVSWWKSLFNKASLIAFPVPPPLHIAFDIPNKLSLEQQMVLEIEVTREEIKKAVWDCGVDKSPGPDGFTFGFYRRYWTFLENDVFVRHCQFCLPDSGSGYIFVLAFSALSLCSVYANFFGFGSRTAIIGFVPELVIGALVLFPVGLLAALFHSCTVGVSWFWFGFRTATLFGVLSVCVLLLLGLSFPGGLHQIKSSKVICGGLIMQKIHGFSLFEGDDDNCLFTVCGLPTLASWQGDHTQVVVAAMAVVWHGVSEANFVEPMSTKEEREDEEQLSKAQLGAFFAAKKVFANLFPGPSHWSERERPARKDIGHI
ncbi:hypothetical protein Tco_1282361 [Tanacetum coccineum]